MRLPNFNRIAFAYDTLKYLVFGKALRQAQNFLVPFIPEQSKILIVGGGTGQIILDILKSKEVKEITYVELSDNMLNAAKARAKPYSNINFVLGSAHELAAHENFDVIFTPFVLDLYSDEELRSFVGSLDKLLSPGGFWMISDFKITAASDYSVLWQRALVKSMYLFFSLVSDLKVRRLPDYDAVLKCFDYRVVQHRAFFGRLVHSQVLLKAAFTVSKP